MINLDALISHIYKSLCSALRDGVSILSLLNFLKYRSHVFFRQKRKRIYAASPTLMSAGMLCQKNYYHLIA